MKIDVPELPEGMKSYVVTWVAGFVASSPDDAARQARAMWGNPKNEVVAFQVRDFAGVSVQVLTTPANLATPPDTQVVLQRCVEAMEAAASRFNMLGNVNQNGASAATGYNEMTAAIADARSLLDGGKL